MKKMTFVALLCAAAMCFPLAACGDDNGNENGGQDPADGTEVTLTKDTDFDALVSDRVTEEEWRAIYSDETFMNVTLKETNSQGEAKYMLRECTDTRWSYMVSMPEAQSKYDTCVVYENGVQTVYMRNDEQWTYMQNNATREEIEKAGQGVFFHLSLIACNFSEYYSKFTYDEANGRYLYEASSRTDCIRVESVPFEYMGNDLDHIELKFKDGRLAYVRWMTYHYTENPDGSIEKKTSNDVRDCYYDYGVTKVAVPENAQPASAQG